MIPTTAPGNPAQRLNINLSPEERTMNATEVAQTTSTLGTGMMPTQLTPHMQKVVPTARRAWAKL
jgi:hypothetical protein